MNKKGFTLVEVLIAIAVISIGLLGAALLMSGTIGGNAKAMALSGATRVAADQLEVLSGLDYDDALLQDDPTGTGLNLGEDGLRNPLPPQPLPPGKGNWPYPADYPADYQRTTADNNYTIYWNVAEDSPVTGTKTVMVVVTSTGLGPQKTVALQNILPRRI